jgi:hypothetical protein
VSGLTILAPTPIAAVATSRGSGTANLLTADPKEVWLDSAPGSTAAITIDLGVVRSIDTIFLGYVRNSSPATQWAALGGIAASDEFPVVAAAALRVPDVPGQVPVVSHALWRSAAVNLRYLQIFLTQPADYPALSVGVAMIGKAFVPQLGQEWGAGRRAIDTGTATPLPSGGFAVVEGARKRYFGWTLGDLSIDEVDQLEAIALDRGETRPVLVVEDAAATPGLRNRIHYGLFERFRAYERRNRVQTKWELGIEEWV